MFRHEPYAGSDTKIYSADITQAWKTAPAAETILYSLILSYCAAFCVNFYELW